MLTLRNNYTTTHLPRQARDYSLWPRPVHFALKAKVFRPASLKAGKIHEMEGESPSPLDKLRDYSIFWSCYLYTMRYLLKSNQSKEKVTVNMKDTGCYERTGYPLRTD
jgi:hypothetical protein